jgi:hypothetical protein
MTLSRWGLPLAMLSVLAIAACDGGTEDDDTNGDSGPKDTGSLPCLEANFTSIYGRFTTDKCATVGCHDAASASGGQNYDVGKDAVHATLLGDTVNAVGATMYPKRVQPSNADASFLWIKVSRDDATGGRMPLAQPPLQQCDLDAIRNWINGGAPND